MLLGRHKNFKMRSNETVNDHMWKHRKPSCTAFPECCCENLPEINLLQARVTSQKNTRALKMHSQQPGCYGHVIGEIQLVCRPDLPEENIHSQSDPRVQQIQLRLTFSVADLLSAGLFPCKQLNKCNCTQHSRIVCCSTHRWNTN